MLSAAAKGFFQSTLRERLLQATTSTAKGVRCKATQAVPPPAPITPPYGASPVHAHAQIALPWANEAFFAPTRLPVDQATTLPPELYNSPASLTHEKATLFRNNWVMVGHKSELPEHGDVQPFEVAGMPCFLANNKGELKAYHNVCRHRGAKLVTAKTKKNMISCPYHRWGYALDGRLMGTPHWDKPPSDPGKGRGTQIPKALKEKFDMGHVVGFQKRDYGLLPARIETWGNMIFANICDGEPALSLEQHIGDLAKTLEGYPLDDMVVAHHTAVKPHANWKILAENFLEYYHLPSVHPELCMVSGVDQHLRTQGAGKYCSFATAPLTNGGTRIDPNVAPPFPGLPESNHDVAHHVLIFPNVFMSIYPHHIFRVILEPTETGETIEHTLLLVHPDIYKVPNAEKVVADFFAFHTKVNNEDFTICETVQDGIRSGSYRGGRFSFRFEETLHRFQNMVADGLLGKDYIIPDGDASHIPEADGEMSQPGITRGVDFTESSISDRPTEQSTTE